VSAPRLPETIGPYRVLRRLGRGGMAEVYVAEDSATGEEHALKIMDRRSPHPDRFNQEYEALTRLNHASIVRVYQYGLYRGLPWFSMELIAGEPLQVWVKRVGRPGAPARTQEVLRAGAFVADAVAYIHDRGLIHRDLKGNNVLMLPDGRVKLLDFGTAHIRDGLRQLTKPGEFIGTLAYASPEQFRGKTLDHRVDIYALGVLLYRMITGHRPFSADDPASLARLIARSPPRAPSELVEDLPDGVESLILELLAKRPDERPSSARVVTRRLEELIGEPLGLPGWGAMARVDRMTAREDVLRRLRALVDPPGRAVLLLGQPGSDRSRVADTLASDVRQDGELSLTARLSPRETVVALLDALLAGVDEVGSLDDTRVAAAVKALRLFRRKGHEIAVRNREGLSAAAASVLVGLARQRGPTLLVLHDLEHAGPPLLDLLGHLLAKVRRGGLPVRFLLSAEQGGGEVIRQVSQRIPDVLRVALSPLDIAQVALKVGAMLDRRPPPTALARTIHQASGGQPRWVEEVVNQLVEEGAIRLIGEDGNRIEWDVHDELEVPDAALETLLRALLSRPALERRVLMALVLAGPPAPISVLARALGWRSDQVVVILRSLAATGWIRVDGGRVRFTQPLLRRLVPEITPPERRVVFREALLPLLDELEPRPSHVHLFLEAGAWSQAVERALDCADRFLDDLATVDALEVLDTIAPLAREPVDVDPDLLSRALLLHANCLLMAQPIDPALARSLSAARKLALDPVVQVGVQLVKARLQRALGHLINHDKELRAAWELAEGSGDPRMRSIVATFQAEAQRLGGRVRDAARWVEHALEDGEAAGRVPLAWAWVSKAALQVSEGRFQDAEPLVREAMAVFEETGNRRGLWSALPTLVPILRLQGRVTEALQALYAQIPVARRCQEPTHVVRLLLAVAECEADLHRLGRAQEHIDEIDTLVRKGEQLDTRLAASVVRGRILLASGHFKPALMTLEDAHDRGRAAGLPGISELARALMAETLLALDQKRRARDLFASALFGLLGAGDAVSLIEGTLARLRALGPTEPTDKIVKPIQEILDREDLALVEVERLLADARHHHRWRRRAEARGAALEAQARLDALAEALADTDRAALRLHPWSRHIRAILK
jgi:tetratricopeptide (TPR) repeat protein